MPDFTLKDKRIKCILMENDPCPIEPNTEGTVRFKDDGGNIQVNWDNGRTLALIDGVDQYEILN